MLALSLRQTGLQRIGAGFATLHQALLNAGQGLYAILSGLGLFLVGALLTPWMWISLPFTRRAPARADAGRWKCFVTACRRLGDTVLDWTAFSLMAALLIGSVVLALHYMDPPLRESLTTATNIIYPMGFFLALAVLYLLGWLAVRLGAALLAHLGRRLTRQGLQALALVAAVILAGATGAILYAVLMPTPLVALIAGVAMIAGLAGFALISLGPSGVAIFSVGSGGHAPSGQEGRRLRRRARSLKSRPTQPVLATHQLAVSAPPLAETSLPMAAVSGAAPADAAGAAQGRRRAMGRSWSLPRLSVNGTGIMIGLTIIIALLLTWGGGELLLRAVPRTTEPAVRPVEPPASPATPRENAVNGPAAAAAIQLAADGEAADVSWRSGYRRLAARLDDGRTVQQLSLPTAACRAAAIVAFGAASSDGEAARNEALAEHRARWLADWTRRELSRCPDPVPVVIAVTLGQAQPGAPLPAQRAVRLLAIPKEALRKLTEMSDPNMLRDIALASFTGLGEFERFDVCALTTLSAELGVRGWPPACPSDQR